MQYPELIKQVKQRGNFASNDDAILALRTTLQTLGERLLGGETKDLFGQLPSDLTSTLGPFDPDTSSATSLSEFLRIIGEREGVDSRIAQEHARAVFGALQAAVSPEEIRHVRSQLRPEFDMLFDE